MSTKRPQIKTNTNQTAQIRDEKGRIMGGHPPNGFDKNPQNRSDGGWKKEDSISYQYNMLIRLNSSEFDSWLEDNPADKRTMAQEMAHNAVLKAKRDLNYLKEITNRTDGMPTQKNEVTGADGEAFKFIIEGYGYKNPRQIEDDGPPDRSIGGPNEVQVLDLAPSSEEDDDSDQ